MTIYDFNNLGKYIAKITQKETIFKTSIGKIENDDFKYIRLFGNVVSLRHKKDDTKKLRQYKTLNGAINYVNKWVKENR